MTFRTSSAFAVCATAVIAAGGGSIAQESLGQTRVIITPELQVISSAHYQATAGIACTGSTCAVPFPKPGSGKRLNATRVYCLLQASTNTSNLNYARVELQDSLNSLVMAQYVTDVFKSATGTFTFNGAIDLQVGANQHLSVVINLTTANADFALCTLSGTISTLG